MRELLVPGNRRAPLHFALALSFVLGLSGIGLAILHDVTAPGAPRVVAVGPRR